MILTATVCNYQLLRCLIARLLPLKSKEDIQTGAVADKDMEASDRGATKIIKKGELPTSKIKTL